MKSNLMSKLEIDQKIFWFLLSLLGIFILVGLFSAHIMEEQGHHITGMNNQIIWGLPHVFAVMLIVISSGVLNTATLSSVFDKSLFKPLAPLSALFAVAFLISGLLILVLDLGRPDRLIVAMTTYNFKSIFAWNIFLYSGFFVILVIYIWSMLDFTVKKHSKAVGKFAFIWRIVLTTGTGSIFGFLIAREAYATAILAPLFIVMSLLYGTAIYYLLFNLIYKLNKQIVSIEITKSFTKLLKIFLYINLYFLILYHLTNIYISKHIDYELFILFSGGSYTLLFWIGQIFLGIIIPIFILSDKNLSISSLLVIVGGFIGIWVIIIGGQAFPLNIFPNHEIVESSFYDSGVYSYTPSIYEIALGVGGIALALFIILATISNLKFIPSDENN
ncbi:MAG: molybdopterin oxidoreductase [Gammaproteobacteria bacterium]|nr:molybdopterin oxidoreductase [Gammaproteobacteria bacterium]|tara:strand:+ start:8099 stop:9262 length:1164 start_codon:yes stop_codon:yes gene_type:complete